MKRLKVLVVVFSVLLVGTIAFIGACQAPVEPAQTAQPTTAPEPTATPEPPQPIELSLSSTNPPTAPGVQHLAIWAEKVKEESKGLIDIRIYPGSTLSTAVNTRTAIREGVADIGHNCSTELDESYVLGYWIPSMIQAKDAATAIKIYEEIWQKFPDEMASEWKDFKVLWLATCQPTCFGTGKKPVRKLEDFKGLQMRAPSVGESEKMKLFGATPVTMSPVDFKMGLEKNMVDGGCMMVSLVKDFQLGKMVKYYTSYTMGIGLPWFLIMNKDSWNNLHPEHQKVIESTLEWGKQGQDAAWIDAADEAIEYMKSNNIEFIDPSIEERARWDAAIQPMLDDIVVKLNAKGFPGEEILQFIKERNNYYATH